MPTAAIKRPLPPEPAFGNRGLGFGDTVEDDELPF